jgi:hypothetical protein
MLPGQGLAEAARWRRWRQAGPKPSGASPGTLGTPGPWGPGIPSSATGFPSSATWPWPGAAAASVLDVLNVSFDYFSRKFVEIDRKNVPHLLGYVESNIV